jgi:hypothetical protein
MKKISITFDNYLAHWIIGSAQKNSATISVFLRDLLAQKMQEGPIVVNHINKAQQFVYNQTYRNEMGYIIFTAKLLEKLVLGHNEGEIWRNAAFAETNKTLEELKFNNKEQRLCVKLEHELFIWLKSEAARLKLKISILIRNVVENTFMQTNTAKEIELSAAQKLGIKHHIKSYNLLETLVKKTTEDATLVIEEARAKAKKTFNQLFPE